MSKIAALGYPALAQARRVQRLVRFADSEGNLIEAHVGQESTNAPFVSPRGIQFVCGNLGLGHAFMLTGNAAKAADFYTSVLGFRVTDTIAFGPTSSSDHGLGFHSQADSAGSIPVTRSTR